MRASKRAREEEVEPAGRKWWKQAVKTDGGETEWQELRSEDSRRLQLTDHLRGCTPEFRETSDLVFKVEGVELPAHSIMLGALCSTFMHLSSRRTSAGTEGGASVGAHAPSGTTAHGGAGAATSSAQPSPRGYQQRQEHQLVEQLGHSPASDPPPASPRQQQQQQQQQGSQHSVGSSARRDGRAALHLAGFSLRTVQLLLELAYHRGLEIRQALVPGTTLGDLLGLLKIGQKCQSPEIRGKLAAYLCSPEGCSWLKVDPLRWLVKAGEEDELLRKAACWQLALRLVEESKGVGALAPLGKLAQHSRYDQLKKSGALELVLDAVLLLQQAQQAQQGQPHAAPGKSSGGASSLLEAPWEQLPTCRNQGTYTWRVPGLGQTYLQEKPLRMGSASFRIAGHTWRLALSENQGQVGVFVQLESSSLIQGSKGLQVKFEVIIPSSDPERTIRKCVERAFTAMQLTRGVNRIAARSQLLNPGQGFLAGKGGALTIQLDLRLLCTLSAEQVQALASPAPTGAGTGTANTAVVSERAAEGAPALAAAAQRAQQPVRQRQPEAPSMSTGRHVVAERRYGVEGDGGAAEGAEGSIWRGPGEGLGGATRGASAGEAGGKGAEGAVDGKSYADSEQQAPSEH